MSRKKPRPTEELYARAELKHGGFTAAAESVRKEREIIKSIKPLALPHLSMWLTNQLVDYQVRDDGIWLRDYNVRLATFAPNSHALREVLTMLLNEAYRFGQSLTREQADAMAKLPKPRAKVSK